MPATWFLVRAALRRRAGTWVVLALVVALGVGAGLAGLAGARRTASAYPRFLAGADAPELIADVVPWEADDVDALASDLGDLPGVEGSADASAFGVARFEDGRPDYSYPGNFLAPLDDRRYRSEDRPAVLDGRLPDPAATDEVLVNRTFADQHGIGVGDRHASVTNLVAVRGVPLALAGGLAALAVAATIHAIASSIRRRRRSLALLRALGFRDRQVHSTVVAQSLTLIACGAAIGVPIGVATGRAAWRPVADAVGVASDPVTPVVLLAAILAMGMALALACAALLARSAVRVPPSLTLRTE